ncbi:hypothetical protein BFL35_02145 [Clavibacter michiganensis]|nr:hypothetical protein BFL35_02145 [Clavibacter michiganensis]
MTHLAEPLAADAASEPGPARDGWPTWVVVTRTLVAALCRGCLWFVVGLLFWAIAPLALGWHATTVMTGSMEPAVPAGSVVVVMPVGADSLVPGRVVQSDDPDRPGRLRLHRIVSVDETDGSLVTKGDANQSEDSSHVATAQVHGVGILLVPFLGIPIRAWHDGDLGTLAAVALAAAAAAAGTRLDRPFLDAPEGADDEGPDSDADDREEDPSGDPTPDGDAEDPLWPSLEAALGGDEGSTHRSVGPETRAEGDAGSSSRHRASDDG